MWDALGLERVLEIGKLEISYSQNFSAKHDEAPDIVFRMRCLSSSIRRSPAGRKVVQG